MNKKTTWCAAILLAATASIARAQTGPEIVTRDWPEGSWGETLDRPLYEQQGHVKGTNDPAEVFFWDSTGRFRFDKSDPHSLTLGYHWATMDFGTESAVIPHHLDDISLAAAVPIMKSESGYLTFIGGAGYSSNTPFADINGLYGIGHLIYEKPLGKDSLYFSIDYNGNSAFLPDVPLPEVEYVKRTDTLTLGLGFPQDWISYQFAPQWTLTASYAVPYTADVKLEYAITEHVSLFGDYTNFFGAFEQDQQPTTDRIFYEMSRAEIGLRYKGTIKGFYVDAALVAGYAFEQNFYQGFDARDTNNSFASLADEPYIGIQLVGRF